MTTTPTAPPAQNQITDDQVAILTKAAHVVSSKFVRKFPGMDQADLQQECLLLGLQLLKAGKFNPDRGCLGSLAYRHMRNRLLNQYRNRVFRYEAACKACAAGQPCDNGSPCKIHLRWLDRNQAKRNVMCLGKSLDYVNAEKEPNICVEPMAGESDLARLIDERLPLDLRKTYLLMLSGEFVPVAQRIEVQHIIQDLLDDEGLPVPAAEDEQDENVRPNKLVDRVRREEARALWDEATGRIDFLLEENSNLTPLELANQLRAEGFRSKFGGELRAATVERYLTERTKTESEAATTPGQPLDALVATAVAMAIREKASTVTENQEPPVTKAA